MKRIALLLLAALGLCSAPLLFSKAPLDKTSASADETLRLRVELDRPVLPADSRETAVVKVSLEGIRQSTTRRAPINLTLVIDKSGSMGGDKIERAREAALEAVRRLSADDVVSLVVYDGAVRVLVPARRVGDGAALFAAIEGIQAGGSTNLHGGVEAGADELRKHIEEAYTHRVLLLSDGQANVGPRTPEALGSLGALLVREGISVTTIGLGLDFNEDLMTRLARRSDGNTYFVEHSRDLGRIFNEELGDVLGIVARRLVMEIEFPAGVRPVRIVGREGRVEDNRVVVELNQLYGGQEKFALVEVEMEPSKKNATREVARARVRYESAADARPAAQTARVEASFTAEREQVVAAANHAVQADYAANRIAEAKDEVVALVDAGRRDEAAARLRQVGDELSVLGKTYDNAAVVAVAAPAAPAAAKVEADGLSNAERKSYRAEAQQTTSQQRAE
ncbi:MAG: VWA domain-containing protein [Burkholderiales bacterium]|nr:VWA domain-containing protein [Opitutaceae bacterium]